MASPLPPPLAPSAEVPRTAARAIAHGRNAFSVRGQHVYMIGIGGCGMSGLAQMLAGRGATVLGSDMQSSEVTAALEAKGIRVGMRQTAAELPEACDLVVASAAVKPDHPQWLEAQRRGIETLVYAEALGRCMEGATAVCVAGTHGKSTTTAMLGCVLADAGLDPSVIVGATCEQLGGGFRLGAGTIPTGPRKGEPGVLVAEACEFNRSFHNYHPALAVISSVEADHLDVYGSLDAVVESFRHFASLVPPAEEGGRLLIGHENSHRREVTAGVRARVDTIGFSPEADYVVVHDAGDRTASVRRRGGETVLRFAMRMPGAHNAVNAASAGVLALWLGAEAAAVENSLAAFRGLDRRQQLLGEKRVHPGPGGATTVRVFDDYGHHPTEVEVTLRALRESEAPEKRGGRLVCVFQPHQHSRTRHLLEEFAAAFSSADVVIVPHIYFVRDSLSERQRVSAADLVDRLRQRGVQAMHLYPFEAIVEQLQNLCRGGDLLVVMGAGPVYEVARGYLAAGGKDGEPTR